MSLYYWGEAVLIVVHLINNLQSQTNGNKRSSELISQHFVRDRIWSHLPMTIYGCIVYLHDHASERSKLDPRAKKCAFVGYSSTKKAYRCYHPLTQKLYISNDVTFNELEMFYHIERAHP